MNSSFAILSSLSIISEFLFSLFFSLSCWKHKWHCNQISAPQNGISVWKANSKELVFLVDDYRSKVLLSIDRINHNFWKLWNQCCAVPRLVVLNRRHSKNNCTSSKLVNHRALSNSLATLRGNKPTHIRKHRNVPYQGEVRWTPIRRDGFFSLCTVSRESCISLSLLR